MFDLLFIAGTIAFFALMLLYVRFCRNLSGAPGTEDVGRDA